MTSLPRITVGMPVFNGAATIERALGALLDQTFTDVEYVISDNASTDATRDIVERLARQDPRIRYVRQATNIGANANYSFVARCARGEFLKWASASDWCAPTFLERCIEALEEHADAVLAAPRTQLFAGDPATSRPYEWDISLMAESPVVRFKEWFRQVRWNNSFNGLIRLAALRQTNLVEPYMGSDNVLMGHLALLGKFVLIDEPLYYRCMDAATTTAKKDYAARLSHHYPAAGPRVLFQAWKRQFGRFKAVTAAPLRVGERINAYAYLVRRSYWEAEELAHDVVAAVRYAFGGRG